MNETLLGCLLWVVIFYPVWSPRCRRLRREKQRASARSSTGMKTQSGPAWEQDAPFPECFEDAEIGDDL